jgi:methionine--tRNA ligase beta chain
LIRRKGGERNLRVYCSAGEAAGGDEPVDERQALLNRLDIRTGKILSVAEHEEADSLFIESIDVGDEEGPRTIVSGLRPYMPASELEGKDCVVLCNLKPRNMRGVKSHGMLLCASDKRTEGEEKVEVLSPPQGTPVGERLCFGQSSAELPDPDGPNKIQKKKIWEKVQADLQTDAQGGAEWQDLPMVSSVGQVTCKSLTESNIS